MAPQWAVTGIFSTREVRIEKTKRSKNDQKPTRNGKKTKSKEQDKEFSQKSQPDQPDTFKVEPAFEGIEFLAFASAGTIAQQDCPRCLKPLVTKLRNDITNFRQEPNETLFEAWERYKLSFDRCPNHNMLFVTQIDTFYNGLTLRHRDTINAAAGGTFMKRRPEECYDLIENMTAHHNDWDLCPTEVEVISSITYSNPESSPLSLEMADNLQETYENALNKPTTTIGQTQNVYAAGAYNQGGNTYQPQGNRNLLSYRSDNYLGPPGFNVNQNQNRNNQNQNQNRNQGNNQGRNQFFQGANHVQNPTLAYQASAPAYQAPPYQAPVHQAPIPQPQVVTNAEFSSYMKANDAILKNMQTNMTTLTNSTNDLKNMLGQFMKMNTASTSGSGTLLSNTITNPREDLKGDKGHVETQVPNSEPVVAPVVESVEAPVSAPKPNPKPSIPYPSRLNDQKLREKANNQMEKFFQIFQDLHFDISFADALILMPKRSFLKTGHALIDVYAGELTLHVGNKALTFNLDQTSRYSSNYDDISVNRIDVIDIACEEYSQEVLGFSETDAFLAIEDELISPEIDDSYHGSEGDILLLEKFLNDDPSSSPLPPQELKVVEPKNEKIFIDDPPEEKSHFMVKEGIVLGHKISENEIEVDKVKVDKLPHPTIVKGIQSFLGHARDVDPTKEQILQRREALLFGHDPLIAFNNPVGSSHRLCIHDQGSFDIHLGVTQGTHSGDIMPNTPPKRCLTPVFIGPQFIVMPMSWSNLVTLVNVTGKSRKKMKCPKMPFKFTRFSTYRASILWDRSRLHEGTSIYSWPSTTCRNGLKRKRSQPTTLELLLKF
ncbi:hypothetical protein Tco_0173638 [Tanacetum coccineum]